MDIKIIKKVLLITAIPFLFASSCVKDKTGNTPCAGGYSFNATSEWKPQKLTYNIGDTIILNSTISKSLLDQITNSNIDYSNSSGIQGDISIYLLDTITHQPKPGRDSFSIITLLGSFSERPNNQSDGINFNYVETTSSYEFKGGFICKRRGIFGLGVDYLISNGIRGKSCQNAKFSMTVINSDKHLFLHQYALNINPNDPDLQKRGYDFRVQ